MNFIEDIYSFNEKAGLLENGYDDFLESSFQIEEALEGFNTEWISKVLANGAYDSDPDISQTTPKGLSRWIVSLGQEQFDENGNYLDDIVLSDIDRLDKSIDALVFAVGAIAKLGLTSEQAIEAIKVVTDANLQKLSMPKDEFGKLTKPADFVGPESKLQEILDRRP